MAERGLEYITSDQKRRFDVMGGLALAGALLPTAVLTAALVDVDFNSVNPIFQQQRVGQEGRPFTVYKFRTIARELMGPGVQLFGTFDPRADKLGILLRKYGLDE